MMETLFQIVANTTDRQSPKAITDWIPAKDATKQMKTMAEKGEWPHQKARGNQPARPLLELRDQDNQVVSMAPKAHFDAFLLIEKERLEKLATEKAARRTPEPPKS